MEPATELNGLVEEEEASCSEDEEEEEEEAMAAEPCQCLFCEREQASASASLDHCRLDHGVDLLAVLAELGCDQYSCIRLINYIRREALPPSFLSPPPQQPYPWDDDSCLHPVLEQDPLLLVDWECEIEKLASSEMENGTEERVEDYKTALSQALADIEDMRLAVKQLVGDGATDNETKTLKLVQKQSKEEEEEEEEYFSTYSHFSIHLEMLSDRVRTEAYRNFILKNPALFRDKVVLDVGCGTGILSLFAAKAGARLVIGVDQSSMIYNAMDIVRENGYEDRIKLTRGKLEEVQLPVDKVDIIISEWMGYCLLFESMLDTVIFSRDKWLRDPSHIYPSGCCLKLVAVSDSIEREARIDFWDDVYGFKMSCMKREMLREASVQCVDESSVISSTHTLKEIDVRTVGVGEMEFEEPFQLTIEHDSLCHAIVGFFEAEFDGPQYSGVLKTGPQSPPTHWKQTVFHLQQPIPVCIGDVLQGRMGVCKSKQDTRALDIKLSFTHSPHHSPSHTPNKPVSYNTVYKLR